MRRRSTVSPHEEAVREFNRPGKDEVNATTHPSSRFMNHQEIKNRAIQVFYTEGHDQRGDSISRNNVFPFYFRVLHPNGKFRSMFDFVTVIWVLLLVYMIPFQIGFDWYELSKVEKILLNILDGWFAIDILLNFRTGYYHHGTIIMNPDKIVK